MSVLCPVFQLSNTIHKHHLDPSLTLRLVVVPCVLVRSLPPEVLACCQAFEAFYLTKHTGRKVTWQTCMGSADVKANFGGRRHELSVSSYQMCILILFNKVRHPSNSPPWIIHLSSQPV
jgi:hypothetical protein